jgi:hypothetical protein
MRGPSFIVMGHAVLCYVVPRHALQVLKFCIQRQRALLACCQALAV